MASWFPRGLLGSRSHSHAPLSALETQDEMLDEAFGLRESELDEEDLDAPELSAHDVRIRIEGSDGLQDAERGDHRAAPLPAYDSSLTDIAETGSHAAHDTTGASWRDRLSSVVRYGRVATTDNDAEAAPLQRLPHQAVGSGVGNDGVFANLVAKPEAPRRGPGLEIVGGEDGAEKEVPPSYDIAAADAAPPYWETTVIAPQGYLGPDSILVDGLPVGNLFGFAWNLLVSMSFQFVGFLLTYLLHTSHAAKNGSRAGLGITLIQWAFFMRQRAQQIQGELTGVEIGAPVDTEQGKSTEAAWEALWGAQDPDSNITRAAEQVIRNVTEPTPTLHGNVPAVQQVMRVSSFANTWLSYVLLALGTALIVGALLNYFKAIRYAAAVRHRSAEAGAAPTRAFIVPF